jgi:hypothetical protein
MLAVSLLIIFLVTIRKTQLCAINRKELRASIFRFIYFFNFNYLFKISKFYNIFLLSLEINRKLKTISFFKCFNIAVSDEPKIVCVKEL